MDHRVAARQIGVTPAVAFKRALELQKRGDLSGAEKIYRAILKQHPKHVHALLNLATVLVLTERMEEAVTFVRKALNQEPNSATAHTLLARALAMLDRHDEALDRARRAIALDPNLPDAHAILAQGLADLGRYEEARHSMSRAIELAPDRPRFYYYRGQIAQWTPDDVLLPRLEALARRSESLALAEQAELHFALAKAYGDCGDIEGSFRNQIKGGALQRRLLHYDETRAHVELDEVCGHVDAAWIGRHHGVGDPSPAPVFIVGMPRSGTTLVEQILAAHPEVRALGERLTFIDSLAKLCGTPDVPPSLGRRATQWTDIELRRLGALYLDSVRRDAPATAARIIDKLPANFRFVGIIHAALPNARIIHTYRDPVDTCLSIFSILFSGHAQMYSYELGELGRYYREYEKVMQHWRTVLPPGPMLEVRYEDVVDDLELQARRIIAHCGLEWDDACLEFHRSNRAVRTVSHAQVRQPIYRSSIGRPRPPHELLQPLLAALGADEPTR